MDLRFGMILTMYQSAHLEKGKRATDPHEWFGGSAGRNSRPPAFKEPQTPEQEAWLIKFQLLTIGKSK